MEKALKFFLKAFKAIIFSPFYIIYFALYLVINIVNYLIGEVRVIISGFRFGSDNEINIAAKLKELYNQYKMVVIDNVIFTF